MQTFSGFKKYPPKTVRVRNVYQRFDVEQHIIVQSAELDIIGEESSAAHVMFDLMGKFEFVSEKDIVTDFTSMQLTGTTNHILELSLVDAVRISRSSIKSTS